MGGRSAQRIKKQDSLAPAGRQETGQDVRSSVARPDAGVLALQHSGGNRAVTGLLRSGGQKLDPALRAEMEARFGLDFGDVRVHVGEAAATSALAEGARAYTVGRDIVFGEGHYVPGTAEGKRLLAHELAHVVQQNRPAEGAQPARMTTSVSRAAEGEARHAAREVMSGRPAAVKMAASGIQRDDLTDEDKRRLARGSRCPTGNCHESNPPPRPSLEDRFGPTGGFSMSPGKVDPAVLKRWLEGGNGSQQPATAGGGGSTPAKTERDLDIPPKPLPVIRTPTNYKAPPGIANLPKQRKVIRVVEIAVPEYKFGPVSTRMFSQADVVKQYFAVIEEPDPTAGYNFDTYIGNTTTGQMIPAQWVGGNGALRVFMGTRECPGCHFGQGLVVDLKGESFITVMAEGAMNAMAISDVAVGLGNLSRMRTPGMLPRAGAALEADEAALAGSSGSALRTADDEYREFMQMLEDENATEFKAAGEPTTMQPHGGAREARQTVGVTGAEQQSAHGLPRSVGKHVPGYNPDAALTTLQETALHTEMDQPWKDAFQNMRRQGRTTASAQEVYDAVADSVERSSQLSRGAKDTLKLRLKDEMFVEYGLQPGQQLTLPYPNVKPRP